MYWKCRQHFFQVRGGSFLSNNCQSNYSNKALALCGCGCLWSKARHLGLGLAGVITQRRLWGCVSATERAGCQNNTNYLNRWILLKPFSNHTDLKRTATRVCRFNAENEVIPLAPRPQKVAGKSSIPALLCRAHQCPEHSVGTINVRPFPTSPSSHMTNVNFVNKEYWKIDVLPLTHISTHALVT